MSKKRAYGSEQRKTCMIQSKVTPATLSRIDAIVRKYGFGTRYELLRYILFAFLRYADPESETDPADDIQTELGRIFADFRDSDARAVVLASEDTVRLDLTEAILFYGSGTADTVTCRRHSVKDGTSTSSAPAVLDTVLSRLLPYEHGYLKHVAAELGSESALAALDYLIEADARCGTYQDPGFAMNEYGNVPVRKHSRHID